ncbi:MAG: thiamine-phosphate kinase [Armatimonadota bacterium]
MDLTRLGEFGLIAEISQLVNCNDADVVLGIGDDCAVVRAGGDTIWAITTDAMIEGRHFRRDWLTPYEIGSRAMTAALSDIAAMGASPRFAFSSLAIPPSWDASEAIAMARGLASQATNFGACLLGGDTIAAHEHAFIDITLIGQCGQEIWRRDGAQPGDAVCVTGNLGGTAAAIAARLAGLEKPLTWQRYAAPVPRVETASALSSLGAITAALDISDGLVQDAGHLCDRSGVGIRLHADRLPISGQTQATARALARDAVQWALSSGEEFELLLTTPPHKVECLQAATDLPLTVVGEVVEGAGVAVIDASGSPVRLVSAGWDHFADTNC